MRDAVSFKRSSCDDVNALRLKGLPRPVTTSHPVTAAMKKLDFEFKQPHMAPGYRTGQHDKSCLLAENVQGCGN